MGAPGPPTMKRIALFLITNLAVMLVLGLSPCTCWG
jgi:hypothetical protein